MEKSILITSAGRRVSLLRAFQEAAHPEGYSVIAADCDPLAPCLQLADRGYLLPRIESPSYLDELRDVALRENVAAIVPTIDTELEFLAANHGEPAIYPLVSLLPFVRLTLDKWETFKHFEAAGIAVPRSWLPDSFPTNGPDKLFIKPRFGSASVNAFPCSVGGLLVALERVKNPVIQEFLESEEITIDALFDLQSNPIHYVPRKRLKTLAGESIEGVTVRVDSLAIWIEEVLSVCGRGGARGPITLQAFLTDRGPVLTEINGRFGGGFPLALAAGAEYPKWIIAMLKGEVVASRFGEYKAGLYMTRHSVEIFLDQPFR
ncbi:MAG TPA: ATP-grasp domain-containing protein [Fimbriimonadaceae bacterium]|jgi:carbamoyl-phosphate synthase large subunit